MHNAPSVSFPVGRFVLGYRFIRWASIVLAVFSASIAWPTTHAAVASISIAVVLVAQLVWIRSKCAEESPGHLSWSTAKSKDVLGVWMWQSSGANTQPFQVELSLVLTLQNHMLLVIKSSNFPARMLWLRAWHAPERWLPMRQAAWAHYNNQRQPAPASQGK